MGASASLASQQFEQKFSNEIEASCPATSCVNDATAGPIVFGGKKNNVNITQSCSVSSACSIDASTTSAAEIIAKQSAESKAGLGIAAAASLQDVKQDIANKIKAACGTTAGINKFKQGAITFTKDSEGNQYNLIQKGDIKSQCALGLVSNLVAKLDGDNKAAASGFDPTTIMIVLAIVAVIGGLGYFMLRSKLDVSQMF